MQEPTKQMYTCKLLRAKQVAEKLACVEDTVWALARNDDTFPRPLKLGARHTAWIEGDIDKWLTTKRKSNDAQ